jgi:hypothetical protein
MLRIPAFDLSPLKLMLGQVNNRSTKRKLAAIKQQHFWRSNRAGRMMRVMGPSPPWAASIAVEAARSIQCNARRNAQGPSQLD